jgi:hypothetical protein
LSRAGVRPHGGLRNRQQLLRDDPLLHDRLELVVDDEDRRHAAAREFFDGGFGDALRVGVLDALEDSDFLDSDLEAPALEEVAPFAADEP